MTLKEIKSIKDNLVSSSGKGFISFLKNILMIVLVIVIMFLGSNPEILLRPKQFIESFNSDVFFGFGVLFFLICATYQLGVSINKETKQNDSKKVIEEFKNTELGIKQQEKEEHEKLINRRINISSDIRHELKDLLIKLGASRASVCEMHNGTNNLAGIPFLYLDMTYEERIPAVDFVMDEYRNFNMNKYPFITNHIRQGSWIGSLQDVEREDAHLAAKLKFGDSNYGAFVALRGSRSIIGLLAVTFHTDTHPEKADIIAALAGSAQVISSLLDKQT